MVAGTDVVTTEVAEVGASGYIWKAEPIAFARGLAGDGKGADRVTAWCGARPSLRWERWEWQVWTSDVWRSGWDT